MITREVQSIELADEAAEIKPAPLSGGGFRPEPELDLLSNIVKTFNDQFGTDFDDADRLIRRILDEIPAKVAADSAFQNARQNSDSQNARIKHDKVLFRVILSMMKDETKLFKKYSDNEVFRRWLSDTVFNLTCPPTASKAPAPNVGL